MDILKILNESGGNVLLEDLDFFETELATGGPFDEAYVAACKSKIDELRLWLYSKDAVEDDNVDSGETQPPQAAPVGKNKRAAKSISLSLTELAPLNANPVLASMTPEEAFFRDVIALRKDKNYKTGFRRLVAKSSLIDATFIEANWSFFQPWELGAIISVKQMPEEFLEKYFGALDREKIARYQCFSEAFFIKHFSQLNAKTVLEHGKNEWRKKENMSKQLDVFLRLKGLR